MTRLDFYQEPLFGRSEAAPFDAVRLHLSNRSSSNEILLATEGQEHLMHQSHTAPVLEKKPRIKAYWWEFSGGYRLEWVMAANDVVNRRLQLIQLDHNWIEPIERKYQFNIEPLIGQDSTTSETTLRRDTANYGGRQRWSRDRQDSATGKCRHFWPQMHGTQIL